MFSLQGCGELINRFKFFVQKRSVSVRVLPSRFAAASSFLGVFLCTCIFVVVVVVVYVYVCVSVFV